MLFDISNHLGGVLLRTGLQVAVRGGDKRMPKFNFGLGENYLEFIAVRNGDGSVLLRGTGEPIDAMRGIFGAVGLEANHLTCLVECVEQGLVKLQRRLAACKHDMNTLVGGECLYGRQNLARGHLCVGCKIGVTERTMQVAAAEADENGRAAGEITLALQGIENLVDTIGLGFGHRLWITRGIWNFYSSRS